MTQSKEEFEKQRKEGLKQIFVNELVQGINLTAGVLKMVKEGRRYEAILEENPKVRAAFEKAEEAIRALYLEAGKLSDSLYE